MVREVRQQPLQVIMATQRPGVKWKELATNMKDLVKAIISGRKVVINGAELRTTPRLRGEIQRVDYIYNAIANASADLVASDQTNHKPNLLLDKDGDVYKRGAVGQYMYKAGWSLCLSSLIMRQNDPAFTGEINGLYKQMEKLAFLHPQENFIPQRKDFMHWHLLVGREVTALKPTKEQIIAARDQFMTMSSRLVNGRPAPRILVGGVIIAPDGSIMLKAYPLDETILDVREAAEEPSQVIDQIFLDKNQGEGARKAQAGRLYHITLGRLTEQLDPRLFGALVAWSQDIERQQTLGVYSMAEAQVVTDLTAYFQHPLEIGQVHFAR